MVTCRIVVPQTKEACGKEAKRKIIFQDKTHANACAGCALYIQQTAGAHGATVIIETLETAGE